MAAAGERGVRTAAWTGGQALERTPPGLPLAPGQGERREVAYRRHGTCPLILRRAVASGQSLAPTGGPRRTARDFLAPMQALLATEPTATRWPVVVDHLDIHRAESLVRLGAAAAGLAIARGTKGKDGMLANRQARAAFLRAPSQRLVFPYTPTPASGLNQIDIGFRRLGRKRLKRMSCRSREELQQKVFAFIASYNEAMAKPFTWTSQGKVLTV